MGGNRNFPAFRAVTLRCLVLGGVVFRRGRLVQIRCGMIATGNHLYFRFTAWSTTLCTPPGTHLSSAEHLNDLNSFLRMVLLLAACVTTAALRIFPQHLQKKNVIANHCARRHVQASNRRRRLLASRSPLKWCGNPYSSQDSILPNS